MQLIRWVLGYDDSPLSIDYSIQARLNLPQGNNSVSDHLRQAVPGFTASLFHRIRI